MGKWNILIRSSPVGSDYNFIFSWKIQEFKVKVLFQSCSIGKIGSSLIL